MGTKHDHHVNKLRLKLLKKFKQQFIFKVKPRSNRRNYIDKSLEEGEYVSILNFKYNFITCKICKKFSKAQLDRCRTCIKCYSKNFYIRDRETFAWSSWANIA